MIKLFLTKAILPLLYVLVLLTMFVFLLKLGLGQFTY